MSARRSLVALSLLATSCAGLQACSSEAPAPPDLATRLEADTGAKWAIYTDPASHEVRMVAPITPVRIGSGTNEEDARAFFDRYRDQLHGTGKRDELRLVEATDADDGTTHLRFEHFLPGTNLPVFDVTSTAHFTADGSATWLRTGFRADLGGVAASAAVAEADALRAAVTHLDASCGAGADPPSLRSTELGVRADDGQPASLAYRVEFSFPSERCVAPEVLVDATTGAVLDQHERASASAEKDEKVPGVRNFILDEATDLKTIDYDKGWVNATLESDAVETLQQASNKTSTDAVERTNGVWDSNARYKGVGVSAHYWGGQAARFFRATGLCGCKDNDANTASACNQRTRLACKKQTIVIHDTRLTKGNTVLNDNGIVYIGDGSALDNKVADMPGAAGFDVIAHEMAHSIVQRTSGLREEYEPGALNESFADVVGASAEAWLEETTKEVLHPLVFGELWTRDGSGKRDMVNPQRIKHLDKTERPDADPDHYSGKLTRREGEELFDGDFIHRNAGIANRAFSLMTIGGTNSTSKLSVAKPIGWKKAREIWYKSIPSLSPQSKLLEAAVAQMAGVTPGDVETFQAVACAWMAVGVVGAGGLIDPRVALLSCPAAGAPAPAPPPPAAPPRSGITGAPSTCAGLGDGTFCDSSAPDSAIVCKNGGIVGTEFCADSAQHCKRASATDPTASFTSDGALVCE